MDFDLLSLCASQASKLMIRTGENGRSEDELPSSLSKGLLDSLDTRAFETLPVGKKWQRYSYTNLFNMGKLSPRGYYSRHLVRRYSRYIGHARAEKRDGKAKDYKSRKISKVYCMFFNSHDICGLEAIREYLDQALVQWQNMAACENKNVEIVQR